MKILKKIGLGLVVLILIVIIVSLFFPKEILVSESTTINAPIEIAFQNVNTMENWKKWGGPWHEEGMDYNKVIQRTEGLTSGVGSKLIYDQGKGEGSVEIIESDNNRRIKTLITFADAGTANGEWFFETTGNTTKVTWGLKVDFGYNPLKRIIGNIVLGDKIGPLFQIGLTNLKTVSE